MDGIVWFLWSLEGIGSMDSKLALRIIESLFYETITMHYLPDENLLATLMHTKCALTVFAGQDTL